jgi:hypothetical protein
VQPFDGRYTTLERDAPELRCGADGKLVGATYSDHGHVIIGGVFSPQAHDESRGTSPAGLGQPGRVSVDATSGLTFQGEHEYAGEGIQCTESMLVESPRRAPMNACTVRPCLDAWTPGRSHLQ